MGIALLPTAMWGLASFLELCVHGRSSAGVSWILNSDDVGVRVVWTWGVSVGANGMQI